MKKSSNKGVPIRIINVIRVNVAVKKAAKWAVILMMARCSADISVGVRGDVRFQADVDLWADGARFQRPTCAKVDMKAVLARLSVWSPAKPSPKQPDQQPLLPPFAVRLHRSKSGADSRTPSAPLALAARLTHL